MGKIKNKLVSIYKIAFAVCYVVILLIIVNHLIISIPKIEQIEFSIMSFLQIIWYFCLENDSKYLLALTLVTLLFLKVGSGHEATMFNFIRLSLAIFMTPLYFFRHLSEKLFAKTITIGLNTNQKYKVSLNEFKQGGVIAGAIGTGKTTLRLNIMKQMISSGISIIDIDYKGDAPRMKFFNSNGIILIPGVNLHIDLFSKPDQIKEKDFIGILYRSFLETINEAEITPPQKIILYEAIKKTVVKKGNLQSFLKHLIMVGLESKEIIDNYQKQSALALVNKFLWLQSNLGNVFSSHGETLTGEDLLNNNIFIDLSLIQHKSSIIHIRFLLDIIVTQMMLEVKSIDSDNFSKGSVKLRKVLFLDEAHMLIPPSNGKIMSKMEELISTLRFKGFSVIATTTDARLITPILHDSSFIAQFRTQSNTLSSALGIPYRENNLISLLNYQFYLKCEATGHQALKLSTISFKNSKIQSDKYIESVRKFNTQPNQEFIISTVLLKIIGLESLIFDSLLIEPLRKQLIEVARRHYFVRADSREFVQDFNSIRNILYHHYFKFIEDENICGDLKQKEKIKGFLLEILLLRFAQNIKLVDSKVIDYKQGSLYNKNYQTNFRCHMEFIDTLLNDFRPEINNFKVITQEIPS